MKKKGFTLIELLAVIVILAIIALIAIPLVLKYIQTSRDNARLRSAENYLDAVEKAVVNQNMSGKKFNPNVCNVKDEKLYCDGTLLDVSIKGVKPDNSSVITFNNGKIDRVKLLYEDKIIVDNEKDILVYGEDEEILPAGLYDDNNSLLATWDELVNKYGLNIEADYTYSNYKTSGSMYAVLNNNPDLSSTTKVIVKDGITQIGQSTFDECNNLKKIILPESIISIGNFAFNWCNSLQSVNIPKNVTSIGSYAFYGCNSLQSIDIPDGVTIIQASTFNRCENLSKVTLPSTLTKIGTNAFSNCANLKKVNIPENVTSIGNYAFSNTILEEVTLPNKVTSIGTYAFNRTNLKEILISKNVTQIGFGLCSNCKKLEKIIVDDANTVYNDNNGSNIIVETATKKLVMGSKNAIIPEGITVICDYAFEGLGLKNITIPNSVTQIGKYAFEHNDIENITLTENITTIGNSAFDYNINLKELIIPKSVTSIGNSIVAGCEALETIKIDQENPVYDSRDNSNAIIKTSSNELISGCKNTTIPNGVTSIGNFALYGFEGLTEITIPETVTRIGYQSFGSVGLKNLIIPDSVTSIGSGAFFGCENLETVTISKNVTSLKSDIFIGSDNLKTIYYKGTATGAPWGAKNATVISDY